MDVNVPKIQLPLFTSENGSNEMLDNFLPTEYKYGQSVTTSNSPHFYMQARNFKTLKTNISSTTIANFRDPERRGDQVPQCRITITYAKETMIKLLK